MDFLKCTKLLVLGSLAGCVTDELELGDVSQEIGGYGVAWVGSTDNFAGNDTGWPAATSTCVLTAVDGNLTVGEEFTTAGIRSTAGVGWKNGNWWMYAHGGAYDNGGHPHAEGNPVGAGIACVPYAPTAANAWISQPAMYGVAAPVFLAPLAPNRRCFLTRIISGIWTQSQDEVSVKKVDVPGGKYNAAGWYVEGTIVIPPFSGGNHTQVEAKCIDFPAIGAEWGAALFGPDTNHPVTTGFGTRMCGLTKIRGSFNVSSYSDGVTLTPPGRPSLQWKMTVSANKYGEADCIQ